MKLMQTVVLSLVAMLTLSSQVFAGESTKEGWPSHLRVLTGPNGGQWFNLGDPIADTLSREVLTTTSRIGGGVDNLEAVHNKVGDIGFTLSCFLGASRSGEAEYKNLAFDNVIVLNNVYPQVLYFLVRKDFAAKHGIVDVETLLQKRMPLRFASLRPGTASEFILTLLLKYGYDTSFEKLSAQGWDIMFNNYAETADNFVDGQIDCFAYTAGTVVPLIKTMEQHTDVLILPVSQKVLDLLAGKFKTSTYVIPPGIYDSVTSPLLTLGDYTTQVVRKDLPDDLVYSICHALWYNKDYIARVVEDFGQLSPETALPEGLEVHPGARKFWTEIRQLNK